MQHRTESIDFTTVSNRKPSLLHTAAVTMPSPADLDVKEAIRMLDQSPAKTQRQLIAAYSTDKLESILRAVQRKRQGFFGSSQIKDYEALLTISIETRKSKQKSKPVKPPPYTAASSPFGTSSSTQKRSMHCSNCRRTFSTTFRGLNPLCTICR